MELTQEYFDSVVKNLATQNVLKPLATKSDVTDAVDELARLIGDTVAIPMQQHFEQLHGELSMRERLENVETGLREIKMALHLSS